MSCGSDLRAFREEDEVDDPTLDDLEPVTVGNDESDREVGAGHTIAIDSAPGSGVSGQGDEQLRDCPACGSPNSPRRYLCGRCGADLETGEGSAVAEVVPNPTSGARVRHAGTTDQLEGRGADRRWKLAAAVVAVGLVVGGGLGAMILLGIGPFASDEGTTAAAPVFDRASYPDQPTALAVSTVAASTSQAASTDELDASQLLDGDLTTAWNSRGEVNPDGVGEIVEVEFADPVWLSTVIFANGDQEDDQSFVANARAKRIRVELDGGSTFIANLLDEPGEQAVRLPTPRFTTRVRFEILEVYPGDTYDDLALSEVAFRGFVANPDDAAVAVSDGDDG